MPETPADLELSVVMPCLDEARTVGRCVDKALQALRELGVRGEVVVADNGSTDGSPEIAALAGHEAGEVVGVTLDELGEVVEEFGPPDAALSAPEGVRSAGGGDGQADLFGRTGGEAADDFVVAGGAAAVEGGAVGGAPLAGDEVAAGDHGGHGIGSWKVRTAGRPFVIVLRDLRGIGAPPRRGRRKNSGKFSPAPLDGRERRGRMVSINSFVAAKEIWGGGKVALSPEPASNPGGVTVNETRT